MYPWSQPRRVTGRDKVNFRNKFHYEINLAHLRLFVKPEDKTGPHLRRVC